MVLEDRSSTPTKCVGAGLLLQVHNHDGTQPDH